MSVDVVTQVEIARPRDDVASYASDPMNATKWYRNIDTVTCETSPPLAVGSRVRFRARFLGPDPRVRGRGHRARPDGTARHVDGGGPFPMETSYRWEDTAQGTRMTLRNRGEPEGYLRMVNGVIGAAMRRANRADLARLKALVEAT